MRRIRVLWLAFALMIAVSPILTSPTHAADPRKAGDVFRDCGDCPEMVVVPAGSFRMGDLNGGGDRDEKPVHRVTIPRAFGVGKYEVTRDEFARFVDATGHDAGDSCRVYTGGKWKKVTGRGWRSPGYAQTGRDPVTCMNWHDAEAYVSWLSRETGKSYHLLSESEWEYMARAGRESKYSFGSSDSDLCTYGNAADAGAGFSWRNVFCGNGYGKQTAPVGSFKPNRFGIYDTVGNVWEWVGDCWHKSYAGAPTDGSAWTTGVKCLFRVLRGGAWYSLPRYVRSANRNRFDTGFRNHLKGVPGRQDLLNLTSLRPYLLFLNCIKIHHTKKLNFQSHPISPSITVVGSAEITRNKAGQPAKNGRSG